LASGRVNLTIQNNEGMTPIDLVRNKEKGYIWVHKEFLDIADLLETFERDPHETRIKLRIQLGYPSNFHFFLFFFFSFQIKF